VPHQSTILFNYFLTRILEGNSHTPEEMWLSILMSIVEDSLPVIGSPDVEDHIFNWLLDVVGFAFALYLGGGLAVTIRPLVNGSYITAVDVPLSEGHGEHANVNRLVGHDCEGHLD
jgi:hypothetical protein